MIVGDMTLKFVFIETRLISLLSLLTLLLLVQIYDQTIEATLNQCYGGQWLLTAILHSNIIPHMSVGFSGLLQSVYKLHVTENPNGCWRLAMVYFVQVSLAGGDLLLGVSLFIV